jgi:hypothetical protein
MDRLACVGSICSSGGSIGSGLYMCAIQGASPSGRLTSDVGRGRVELDEGLLVGLSLGDVFRVFGVVRGALFRPTDPVAALFSAFALEAEVMDCVVR